MMIKYSLRLASFFLLLCTTLVAIDPKIVVIGAGIGGLTAAHRLNQRGYDVQVYEARNRVGGRMFSARICGHTAELGAQNLFDGGEAEHLKALISEFQLETCESTRLLEMHYWDGTTLYGDAEISNRHDFDPKELRAQLDVLAQQCHSMQEILEEILDPEDLFYKTIKTCLAGYEGAPLEQLSPVYVDTLYHMLLGGVCNAHPADETKQSMSYAGIKGGNSLLPLKIAESLGTKIHLNTPLSAISKNKDSTYTLTFTNGQTTQADILILAIPCTVFSDISFEEGIIPSERLKAMCNIPYAKMGKVVIPLHEPAPDQGVYVTDGASTMLGPTSNIANLFLIGTDNRFTSDTVNEVYANNLPFLQQGYRHFSLNDASFARDEQLGHYNGPVGQSWSNDSYSKGCYTSIVAGQEHLLTSRLFHNGETVRTLFAPIDDTLFFAGEHASIMLEVTGTMEAACESGERTARLINNAHNMIPNSQKQ